MPYSAPGERVERVAGRVINHNAFCVVGNEVGYAAKVSQLNRFVDPTSAAATQIQIGEAFTLFITGVHEIPLSGGVAAAVVGSKLWIDPDDDAVKLDANKAAGDLPLGVVDEIDTSRTPDVARVNLNAWHAFLVEGGTVF